MARGRMLNKSICLSLKFDQLPDDTCRLLATWLISHLDHRGVFYADPTVVKAMVFPRRTDVTIEDVASYTQAMIDVGLIQLFTNNGQQWQWWPGFTDNQVGLRADREKTDFPPPPETTSSRQDDGKMTESGGIDAGKMPAEVKGEVKEEDQGEVKDNIAADAAPTSRSPPPSPEKPPEPSRSRLSEGQRRFLALFGAKRFKTVAARDAVLEMEQHYGTDKLLEAGRWAAEKQMSVGRAIGAIRTALPTWGAKKPPPGATEPAGFAGIREWLARQEEDTHAQDAPHGG